jgi:molybdopterin biosynthesis enzyme MoaB
MSQSRQYFSELEKSLITELVSKHKNVIESKRNDYKGIKQNTMAWETLTEEFNSQAGVKKRESKQIKKCWENMKSRAKKSIAKEKREAKLTGGGTPSTERDEGAAAVVSIIPAQMTSLYNPFDDDNYEPGKIIGTE